jgi:putative addiction module component (TIGR02574 family)
MSLEELLSAASRLNPKERLLLSDMLRETVAPEEWPPLSDDWLEEIDRRAAEYDAGRMPASSWTEVKARVRKQAGLDG